MYIIFIRNYKLKILAAGSIAALWIFMFLISGILINHKLLFKITINGYLAFSYPIDLEVDNIYVNQQLKNSSIQTNSNFSAPLARKFSSYQSLDGKFSFDYPSAFVLNRQTFTGSEILYHIDFHDKANTTHGFVQVWNLSVSLQEFIEKSKSTSQLNFKYFKSKEIMSNGLPGYYWNYSVLSKSGKYYTGSEVFLQKGDKAYRISYFVPEELWNSKEYNMFWNMVKSFKIY